MLRIVVLLVALIGMAVAGPAAVRSNRSENETSSVAPEVEAVNEVSSAEPEVTAGVEMSTSSGEVSTTASATTTTTTVKPRKTITFDQRQQGKFNIRADLENFVIVVVPSSPSAGISLLDLLNRSGQKGALQKKKSAHRKGVKHHGAQKKAHHSTTPEVVVLDESQSNARVDNEEFIEGRTPYKVDISSAARSNDVPTADMPSPIYRVMRPFNYEQPSSSNMIRFPSPSSSSGNYYDDGEGSTVVRQSKALAIPAESFDEIRTNTVYAILTNNNNHGDGMLAANDDDDNDDNYLTAQERTYLDLPPFHPSSSSFDSLEDTVQYPRSDVDMAQLQLQQPGDSDFELKLLGAQEQCGPDRRRDSYGICQFVAP